MADACIVCLGDLRTSLDEDPLPEVADALSASKGSDAETSTESHAKRSTRDSPNKFGSAQTEDETIAHLLPCKHDLHNACLKPWVERANSCPICRTKFNMVELSHTVGGAVFDSYAVQDKVQEAELDPGMVVEEELFAIEAWEHCLQCDAIAEGDGVMYCDGCDRSVHIFCAGFDNAPEVWYCETCLIDMENDTNLPGMASAIRRRTRRRTAAAAPPRRRLNRDATWARIWQEVTHRARIDLDFPFDEEPTDQRTEEQRREFQMWSRRFEVADRQGATDHLRGLAAARLNAEGRTAPGPESQEVLRAWNAFDKARESQEAPVSVRRRKRRADESPAASPREADQSEQPQLKRPRLSRRPLVAPEPHAGESSSAAMRRAGEEPTFLSALLREVEIKPTSAGSPAASEQVNGQYSPRNSSPMQSPSSSEPGTPRAASTPPPQRPLSPPLSSTIVPAFSSAGFTFSPFSPAGTGRDFDDEDGDILLRGRRRKQQFHDEGTSPTGRASSNSPSRALSYSAKEEIQRMVKLALGSRYRDGEISKDQYTDVNRDVSRKLYDLVGDASALSDQTEREKWQNIANDEVQKAVTALSETTLNE